MTIWKLRNKEVFEEKNLEKRQWESAWEKNIEERIRLEYSIITGSNTKQWKKKMNDFMETWGKDEKVITVREEKLRIEIPKE